ncbi:MAG: VCBS repeat-containing protein [Candidatus Omnitrophica bacterium]|nr:VCBS repeat-containing protein [Candidatus Omnitrophota bacterium]
MCPINKRSETMLFLFCSLLIFQQPSFAATDYLEKVPPGQEDTYEPGNPVVTDYQIDIDGDGRAELVCVNYGPGVSDKSLEIEIRKGDKLIDTVKNQFGIQPNYKIEDVDKDGKKEIIVWGGLWDPRMAGEDGVTEETVEGHSAPHRYVVATYKLIRAQYYLWDVYSTKKKYEPFCEQQPARD